MALTSLTSLTTGNVITLNGLLVDNHTRCAHYHLDVDIIAIKFKCCNTYFPCYKCHEECGCDQLIRWNEDDLFTKQGLVILCGQCYHELTYEQYSNNSYQCMFCSVKFNPGCSLHTHLYFDIKSR